MSYSNMFAGYHRVNLGSLDCTGGNETFKVITPSGIAMPLLQAKSLTAYYGPAETWVPVGVAYIITTGITVNAAVITLRKNGVSAATGGTASLPVHAINANETFAAFSNYTFAAADAAGDAWSVLVTTTSTAGVVNPVSLIYGIRVVGGIATGVTE